MTSKLARYLIAALLLALSDLASAGIRAIDLQTVAGVPGTGGYSSVDAPCYCQQQAFFSPIMLLEPGTYDFGEVRDYWVQAGGTPDGGPDQPNGYLLFDPMETSGTYPDDFPPPATYAFPAIQLCNQDDAACNASFNGAFVDFNLIFTVLPGQNAAQIGFVGPYQYTPPVPEPFAFAMFILGLILIGGMAEMRGQRRLHAASLAA